MSETAGENHSKVESLEGGDHRKVASGVRSDVFVFCVPKFALVCKFFFVYKCECACSVNCQNI